MYLTYTQPPNFLRVTSTMEYRPNSGPESQDVGPSDDATDRSEYLAIKHATEFWNGPKCPVYNCVAARLRSFTNWPKTTTNPSPASLSRARFYFTGKICYRVKSHTSAIKSHTTFFFSTGLSDIKHCFYCGLTLNDWSRNDVPSYTTQFYRRCVCLFGIPRGTHLSVKRCTNVIEINNL
jgi:hypothetical protein